MRNTFKRYAAGTAAALAFAALPAHAAPILNGGFEDGFANWTRADQTGSEGTFTLQSGTTSPVTNMDVPAPPQGANAAMTDAEAGGSHALYQDFMQATPVTSARLSFDLFVGNRAEAFFLPAIPTLDWATAVLNQQARVDILAGGSDPFSMATEDLLLNLFATELGDPLVSGYNHFSIDITDLLNANLNQTLRLRFSEVDNVNMFQFGVDNVALEFGDPADVPEPASALLILAGLAAGAMARRGSMRR
jgi:hypothetical protein